MDPDYPDEYAKFTGGEWRDAWHPSMLIEYSQYKRVRVTTRVSHLPGEERPAGPYQAYKYVTPWHGNQGLFKEGSEQEQHIRLRWKYPYCEDDELVQVKFRWKASTRTWVAIDKFKDRIWLSEPDAPFLQNLADLPHAM